MIATVTLTGTESDAELRGLAFEMFAAAHPHEAYDQDPEAFWQFFHQRCPEHTREKMLELLESTR